MSTPYHTTALSEEISAWKAEHRSALEWGDFKAAYRAADHIELLEIRLTIARLGQASFDTARAMFPKSMVIHFAYSKALEVDGDFYVQNLHDCGHVMGWHRM